MRDTNLLRAVDSIDYDLAEAEQMVSETSGEEAHAIVATAKIKAADAKEAYQNGKYCKAYHIYMDTYGHLAECYASAARDFANQADDSIASRAADMAAVYAASALTGGLDVAISSTRNSKMYAEAARVRMQEESEPDIDYNDPNLANDLATVAQRYAELAKSKPAATDAKDASGKAYMGSYANSYAASAKSFYETTEAFNAMCSNEESSAALAEARQYANESAAAARDGKTEEAFINALLAQECAERAGRSCNQKDIERAKKEKSASEAPLARNELQQKIDEINATVHFNFASANPRFDDKTDDVITEMCNSLAADKDRKVIITGHTDNVGSAAVNRKYGMKRARALKRLMVKRGAPVKQISCKSKGMSQPEVPNSNAKNRAKNRRATIELQ